MDDMQKFGLHFLIIALPCILIGLIPVVGWIIGGVLFIFLANKTGLFK